MNQNTSMDQVIEEKVNLLTSQRIVSYHDAFIRNNGGIPASSSGAQFQKAVAEVNHMLSKDEDEKISRKVASNALDLLAVLNAQQFDRQEDITLTVGLLATLAKGDLLTDLTGEDDEWRPSKEDNLMFNWRDPRVVKSEGKVFFTEGLSFPSENGEYKLDGKNSWVEIDLPVKASSLKTVQVTPQEEESAE
ncbi:hypothetical protein Q9X98_004232 [Vibrio parahaemolyticus]|nr:hypothetical protein [Vibrio parahaemolyticus]